MTKPWALQFVTIISRIGLGAVGFVRPVISTPSLLGLPRHFIHDKLAYEWFSNTLLVYFEAPLVFTVDAA